MPFVNPNALAETEALANAPTLGNLHPDARRQAIARATLADFDAMRKRMEFLHIEFDTSEQAEAAQVWIASGVPASPNDQPKDTK